MARFNLPINSFIAGEMSPGTRGRSDIPQYAQGCEELFNMQVDVQGGASRRAGSIFSLAVASNNTSLGTNQAQLALLKAAAYVRAFPLYASNGDRQLVLIRPIVQATTNERFAMVMDADSGSIRSLSQSWGSYSYVRTVTADQLRSAQYAQAGDVLVITIPGHPPLTYFYSDVEDTAGLLSGLNGPGNINSYYTKSYNPYSLGLEQLPFVTRNVLNNQGNGSMTAGVVTASTTTTLTCSRLPDFFTPSHLGVIYKLNTGTSSSFTTVTSATATNVATVYNSVLVLPSVGPYGNSGTTSWEESAWSDVRGWPVSVTYHQQRLYYLMANGTVYASATGNIFFMMARRSEQDPAFSTTVVASDPYSFTIASREPPIGRWIYSAKNLQMGTLGREFISTSTSALTPDATSESALGSAAVQPVRIDNALYFVQRAGQSIRQLTYNNDEDSYQAVDLNIMANHMAKKSSEDRTVVAAPRFVQMEAQLSSSPMLWAVDINGGLCSCTIDRGSQVFAWSYHELGGSLDGEAPKVLSIAVLPSNEGRHDDMFAVVARTINGANTIHFERINRPFELDNLYNSSTDIDDKPVFADCAILYTPGSPTTVCTGLTHLEGEAVDVLGNGKYLGRFTVASGQVDVGGSTSYSEFIAGLPYTSRLVTNGLEGGSPIGSSQGLMKRAAKATLRLVRTIGLRYGLRAADLNGTDTDTMYELSFATLNGLPGVPLFTGDKRVDLPLGIDRSQRIVVEQTKSLPMTVSAIFLDGQTNA